MMQTERLTAHAPGLICGARSQVTANPNESAGSWVMRCSAAEVGLLLSQVRAPSAQ